MSEPQNVVVAPGIGLGPILFIVFLILKLVGTISWSWWWVTAPLWIPFCVIFVIAFIYGIIMAVSQS